MWTWPKLLITLFIYDLRWVIKGWNTTGFLSLCCLFVYTCSTKHPCSNTMQLQKQPCTAQIARDTSDKSHPPKPPHTWNDLLAALRLLIISVIIYASYYYHVFVRKCRPLFCLIETEMLPLSVQAPQLTFLSSPPLKLYLYIKVKFAIFVLVCKYFVSSFIFNFVRFIMHHILSFYFVLHFFYVCIYRRFSCRCRVGLSWSTKLSKWVRHIDDV